MHITFAPGGILQVDNARIVYRNFSGAASKFNREGDRNFALVIEPGYIDRDPDVKSAEEIRDILVADINKYGVGWNVKTRPPRDEDGEPFIFLPIKLRMSDRTPIYLKTGDKQIVLDEESVDMLDNIDIANVEIDIRPYDDTMVSGPFRAAYVRSMRVTQDVNRFDDGR